MSLSEQVTETSQLRSINLNDPTQCRDLHAIGTELKNEQKREGQYMLKSAIIQGKLLIEAKEQLIHGEWQSWLNENFWKGERTANTYMKLARGYSNPQSTSDLAELTIAMAEMLLDVPPEERCQFLDSVHEVKGKSKKVREMSDKDFKKLISEKYPKKNGETYNGDAKEAYIYSANTDNEDVITENPIIENTTSRSSDNLSPNIGIENMLKTPCEAYAENINTENLDAVKISANEIESDIHDVFDEHMVDFDDCLTNIINNLNEVFELQEKCQDDFDIFSKLNDELIPLLKKYLDKLGYVLCNSSDNSTTEAKMSDEITALKDCNMKLTNELAEKIDTEAQLKKEMASINEQKKLLKESYEKTISESKRLNATIQELRHDNKNISDQKKELEQYINEIQPYLNYYNSITQEQQEQQLVHAQ